MLQRLPKIFRNFYFLVGLGFFIWMLFFDSNDFITQIKMLRKEHDLSKEKAYYTEKMQEVQKEREQLLNNKELLEKFARERYFMKKPSEDLYVIVEKDK